MSAQVIASRGRQAEVACALLMLAAPLLGCQEEAPEPDPRSRACAFPAFYRPETRPAHIAVIGAFNAWSPTAHPMADPDGDGIYQALVPSTPGRTTYQIYVDGRVVLDPYNPLTLYSEGREQSLADLTRCADPALEVVAVETTADGAASARLQLLRGPSGAAIDPASVEVHIDAPDTARNAASIEVRPESGEIAVALRGLDPGRYQISVQAADARGASTERITLPLWIEQDAFDWRDALIYQIVVDRFRRGGDAPLDDAERSISQYHGGDLWGVIDAIEEGYFERLGVNALWVSPLYDNPEGLFVGRDGWPSEAYHGYWPADPEVVEPRFGGEEALRAFMDAAHRRGLRVIMDAVLNHIHVEHPWFAGEGADPAWFNNIDGECICGVTCPWSTFIQVCWFDPFLADLNWQNPEVIEHQTDVHLSWIERFGLDGLRVDAVPMMPRLAVRHLRHRVHARLEQGGQHTYLLGETYTGKGGQGEIKRYLGKHALSGQFDYPVMWALRDAIAGRAPMTALDAEVLASEEAWAGSGAVMAPILGNHDVARFISDVNGDVTWDPRRNPPPQPTRAESFAMLRMAWTFLLTQPGAPIVYYGDEIGLAGGNDPDNRRDMRFGDAVDAQGQAVFDHVARLAHARRCSAALRRGARVTLAADDDTYAFGRDVGDGHPAVVLLNRSFEPREIEVELPSGWALDGGALRDLFGAPVTHQGRRVLATVPPRSSLLLLNNCSIDQGPPGPWRRKDEGRG